MVNQQKGVQQDTAYSAVVVNDHNYYVSPSMPISFFHVSMTPFVKNDIGTGIHMIIHYNCTIGSILLHSFLLIYHPYPSSIFLRTLRTYACALAQTAPLLSRRLVARQWRLFVESVGRL